MGLLSTSSPMKLRYRLYPANQMPRIHFGTVCIGSRNTPKRDYGELGHRICGEHKFHSEGVATSQSTFVPKFRVYLEKYGVRNSRGVDLARSPRTRLVCR